VSDIARLSPPRLLAPFDIHPQTIRVDEKTTAKGYLRAQFEDAFDRYLPTLPKQAVTPLHSPEDQANLPKREQ
jgi:Protein of unknown function (DUF3631)